MSSALGFDTVAEGVEDPEQQQLLPRMGCSHGQGYGICRPQPPGELLTWLADNTSTANALSPYALSSQHGLRVLGPGPTAASRCRSR